MKGAGLTHRALALSGRTGGVSAGAPAAPPPPNRATHKHRKDADFRVRDRRPARARRSARTATELFELVARHDAVCGPRASRLHAGPSTLHEEDLENVDQMWRRSLHTPGARERASSATRHRHALRPRELKKPPGVPRCA